MIDVREYNDREGHSPDAAWFDPAWFDQMNAQAAAKVATALTRLAAGNVSNVNFGPGYRVYLGKDGERLVILLGEVGGRRWL